MAPPAVYHGAAFVMSRPDPQAAFTVPLDARSPRERRSRMRHTLTVAATVRLRGPALVPTATRILDLSEDGIGVQASSALEPDRTLALDLELDSQHHIRLIGQVAWSEPTGRAGVRFFSPDHASLQELQQWLFLNAVAEAAESTRLTDLIPEASRLADTGTGFNFIPVSQEELFLDEEEQGPHALSPLERDTNAIVSRALALTGATGAALALYEGGKLVCCATCGTDTPALGARIATDSGLTGECMRFSRVMYCADTSLDPRVDHEICLDLGIRSILALPLFAGERVVGLLEVLSQRRDAFDPGDARALDLLSRPVMGLLFAENSSGERASNALSRREPDVSREIVALSPKAAPAFEPALELGYIERRRQALTRRLPKKVPIYQRALAAAAVVAVITAVSWLIVSQSKILTSLRQRPVAAASQFQSPPESPALTVFPTATNGSAKTTALPFADLKASAQHGDASAQFALGVRFANGDGVAQDRVEAAKWFILAAKQGYTPAQSILGACYWAGRGVPQDLKQAYFWTVLARDANDDISRVRADALVSRLSSSEMLEVQQRVRDWNRQHATAPDAAATR
jgi:GAF domain-containing protein